MKARIIKTGDGLTKILCENGSIKNCADQVLAKFLTQFTSITYLSELSGKDGKWNSGFFDMAEYPGDTLAYVTDNLQLIVLNPELFIPIASSSYIPSETDAFKQEGVNYVTIQEYAKLHNRSEQMIRVLCKEKKISGAIKKGHAWIIPENAPYPVAPFNRKK